MVWTLEGDLRLSHSLFSQSTRYQPAESRDEEGFSTTQKALALNGRLQLPGLPSLSGSWVRTRTDPNERSPEGRGNVARNLSALYTIGVLNLRGGIGDRSSIRDGVPDRTTETYGNLGAGAQFQIDRLPVTRSPPRRSARTTCLPTRSSRQCLVRILSTASMPPRARSS